MSAEVAGGPLAVSTDGNTTAIGEGQEILAYDARNESPTWRSRRKGEVLDVVALPGEFVVLEDGGRMCGLADDSGEERWSLDNLGANGKLGASLDGHWALVAGGVLRIGQGDKKLRSIPLDNQDAVAVAFAGDVPVVAYPDGVLLFFPESGGSVSRQSIDPVYDLASDREDVLVACDTHVARMPIEGRGQVLFSFEHPITLVTRSPTGRILAARVGDAYVAAFADEGGTDLGMMRYHDRTVGGIAIDSRGSLWASCGEGHANRLDLDSPDTIYRTDPHEGRPRGSWLVAMNVHAEAGKPNEAVAAEREVDNMNNMPLAARIGLSVFAVVVVIGGWLGLMWLLSD